ncbi:MAG: UvrD-helicase domain-containing protein [Myxococcota bacterium]|nr:UvrD-helicase domain-containing protein [Myxococcota bacterium]
MAGPAPSRIAGLNEAQSAAVAHDDGPVLVLAGAGSGKTRVITHRIARLVTERAVPPDRILAVSFTNKAAEEMAERMAPLIGKQRAEKLWLSTFHSFGVRFLREESRAVLGDSDARAKFVIFDQADVLGLIREIVKREGIADRKLDLWAVLSRISLWKNKMIGPEQAPVNEVEYDVVARAVYAHYEASLRSMRAFDFDDLVLAPVRLLQQREDIREKWQQRFRYMLIDEFQDTNAVQLELVRQLANERRNVCVVGDDDQSIYGWRGADVANILDFDRYFPGTTVIKLEQNYRSRAPILEIANAAIGRSSMRRLGKTLRATKDGGEMVRLAVVGDAEQEARFVAQEIRTLRVDHQVAASGVAVLYRSNLQARAIEEELRVQGIPYQLFGGTQFFDRKQVKDAVAYLRFVVHERDELSLRRILNYPTRGIGDTTITRVERWARAKGVPFVQAVFQMDRIPDVPDAARRGAESLAISIAEARERFATGKDLVASAVSLFMKVGLERELKQSTDKDQQQRWLDVEYVLRSLDRYEKTEKSERPSLAVFLQRITMRFDNEEEATGEKVTLCTLHGAKGLEWPVVFLIGLNEGTLPHLRTTDPKVTEAAPTDVEEERRLFYVGVTRAQERLYLCRPMRREMRGKHIETHQSRFLEGLPEALLEKIQHDDAAAIDHDETVNLADQLLARLRGS